MASGRLPLDSASRASPALEVRDLELPPPGAGASSAARTGLGGVTVAGAGAATPRDMEAAAPPHLQ